MTNKVVFSLIFIEVHATLRCTVLTHPYILLSLVLLLLHINNNVSFSFCEYRIIKYGRHRVWHGWGVLKVQLYAIFHVGVAFALHISRSRCSISAPGFYHVDIWGAGGRYPRLAADRLASDLRETESNRLGPASNQPSTEHEMPLNIRQLPVHACTALP